MLRKQIGSYLQLMKPSIMLLVLLTGATALVLEGSLLHPPRLHNLTVFSLILLGLMLSGGSANAFNMYFEREIDSRMSRTKNRRPLPLKSLSPNQALVFAILIGIAGVSIFYIFFNLISATMSLATILFYSFFYTLYLKPRTPYNIVVGGAAGSMAPVIAWAAVTGSVGIVPIILFLIIFLWTPPHFWALALHLKRDYQLVGYPMMPVVKGDLSTKRQILLYVLFLVIFSAALLFEGAGIVYGTVALFSGGLFLFKAVANLGADNNRLARGLFAYSIFYLLAIFAGLMLDTALKITIH
jgi:protoheme IX farnesyltransferase